MKPADAASVGFGSMSSDREERSDSSLVVGSMPKIERQSAEKAEDRLRVLVVDDSNTYRKQLCSWLEMEELEVVGEAATGWEALELNEEYEPDVVLMDQNMPSMSGVDATRRIKAQFPNTRIIFIAAEEAWRTEALNAGADGYFVKGDDMSQLMTAIQHPAGVWEKPEGWPEVRTIRRKWIWPIVGGAIILTVISLFIVFPSVLVPVLGFLTGLVSLIAGLK
ncbi:MAG: response regulator transcription factor [Anaerolineales bacterium]